jgi:hypothetical protein
VSTPVFLVFTAHRDPRKRLRNSSQLQIAYLCSPNCFDAILKSKAAPPRVIQGSLTDPRYHPPNPPLQMGRA